MAGDKDATNSELEDNDRKFLLFLIGNGHRRRRRQFYPYSSPLIAAVRKRRQIITGGTFLGLPSSYSVNLPLSCCKDSG
ncbi:unnamed protein product, partial [Rotaria sp. Silwood1]